MNHVRPMNATRRQLMAVDAGLEPAKPFFRPDALAMRSLDQPVIYRAFFVAFRLFNFAAMNNVLHRFCASAP